MRCFFVLLLFLLIATDGDSQTDSVATELIWVLEQQPEFKGGYKALMDFIKSELQYPESARKAGIEGIVLVNFLVDKAGNITDVKTLKSLHPDCDAEAERLIRSMPSWIPGRQNGKPADVRVNLPIRFKKNKLK